MQAAVQTWPSDEHVHHTWHPDILHLQVTTSRSALGTGSMISSTGYILLSHISQPFPIGMIGNSSCLFVCLTSSWPIQVITGLPHFNKCQLLVRG